MMLGFVRRATKAIIRIMRRVFVRIVGRSQADLRAVIGIVARSFTSIMVGITLGIMAGGSGRVSAGWATAESTHAPAIGETRRAAISSVLISTLLMGAVMAI